MLNLSTEKKKQFESRGINSVEDLLQYLPKAYRDYRSFTGILPHDQVSVLLGTVVFCERRAGNGRQFVTAICRIEPLNLELTVRWFNMHWVYQEIKSLADRHEKVIIAGKQLEQRIMMIMPFVVILYMRLSMSNFMKGIYGNIPGMIFMTFMLCMVVIADKLGRNITSIEV